MKERLVELIKGSCKKVGDYIARCDVIPTSDEICEVRANYLIANNVECLPCNVGDIVYQVVETYPKPYIKGTPIGVIVIKGKKDSLKELWEDVYGGVIGTFADIGKTVFLTKEEAEQKLKERKEDEGK